MSGINQETSTADEQITRMDQETYRTEQNGGRICHHIAGKKQNGARSNRNRNKHDGAGSKYTVMYRNGSRIRVNNSNGDSVSIYKIFIYENCLMYLQN